MKQNPKDALLRVDLERGRLSRDGFLGDDPRNVSDIISADKAVLDALDLSAEAIGRAMRALSRKGMAAMGAPVEDLDFIIQSDEYMGWLGCPMKDGRRAAKRNTTVTDIKSGVTLVFSDLAIHLIEAHGFFQGKGSPYRLEPDRLARFLKLVP